MRDSEKEKHCQTWREHCYAENLLDRQFYAAKPNEKWLADVTEFKWYWWFAVLALCNGDGYRHAGSANC